MFAEALVIAWSKGSKNVDGHGNLIYTLAFCLSKLHGMIEKDISAPEGRFLNANPAHLVRLAGQNLLTFNYISICRVNQTALLSIYFL